MNPSPIPDRPLMTVPEVVERLRVSRTMLYRLMRTRQLVPVHIGRAIRFEAQAVDAFIQELAEQQEHSRPDNPWLRIRSRQ